MDKLEAFNRNRSALSFNATIAKKAKKNAKELRHRALLVRIMPRGHAAIAHMQSEQDQKFFAFS